MIAGRTALVRFAKSFQSSLLSLSNAGRLNATICLTAFLIVFANDAVALSCDLITPPEIRATKVYVDKAGSVTSAERRKEQAVLLRPLRQKLKILIKQVDQKDLDCTLAIMTKWARQRSFLNSDYTFPQKRQRIRVATSLNILALKMDLQNIPGSEEATRWLKALSQQVARDFKIRTRKRFAVANLQVWAAVNSALYLRIEFDDLLHAHQRKIWIEAIKGIDSRGFANVELRRGRRALGYTYYYYTALNMLAELRRSLGEPVTIGQKNALGRLGKRVVISTCDPGSFRRLAPQTVPAQDRLNRRVTSNALVPKALLRDLEACGGSFTRVQDDFFGGKLEELETLLR